MALPEIFPEPLCHLHAPAFKQDHFIILLIKKIHLQKTDVATMPDLHQESARQLRLNRFQMRGQFISNVHLVGFAFRYQNMFPAVLCTGDFGERNFQWHFGLVVFRA